METTKRKHGGTREGAGRKRLGEGLRQTLAVRLDADALEKLERAAQVAGCSRGQVLNQLINKYLR